MSETIISEGKTTNEAIEKGLKKLNASKNMVEIKVIGDEEKRSFFSILEPRTVKVQLTLKENHREKEHEKIEKKEVELSEEEQKKAKERIEQFLKEFFDKVQKDADYRIESSKDGINIEINNENLGFLIGYRGETLYAFQNILSSIASKNAKNRVKVILDIEGYKAKRIKTLEELAEKLAKIVIKTKKPVTLEPMQAYERKIIHTKLQDSEYVETRSIGEEPRRRVIIELKRNK